MRSYKVIACLLPLAITACENHSEVLDKPKEISFYIDERAGVAYAFAGNSYVFGDSDTIRAILNTNPVQTKMDSLRLYKNGGVSCAIAGYNAFAFKRDISVGSDFLCGGYRFIVRECLLRFDDGQTQGCARYLVLSGCGTCFRGLSAKDWQKRISAVLNVEYVFDKTRGITEITINDTSGSKHLMLVSGDGILNNRSQL